MTQEPRETSTDEPQVHVEETDELTPETQALTDESLDPADEAGEDDISEVAGEDREPTTQISESENEDRNNDAPEIAELEEADETPDEPEENLAAEDREAGDEELEAVEEETNEPIDEDQVAAEAAEVEFEEDQPKPLAEDENPVEETAEEVAESDEEAEDSVEQDKSEDEGDEAEPEQAQAEETEGDTPTVESVIEAILFATDEPLTDNRLANIVETTGKQVRQCIEALNEKYEQNHNAFRIEQIAGGHQMLTLSTYNTWLRKMLRVRSDNKLSPAAMETLAIIAYKQPVIRVDIEAIRGVAVGEVVRSLMYKGLVKIVGRAEILGRPMLYGTTKKFLEVFGLNSLKDLPKAEELKKPD